MPSLDGPYRSAPPARELGPEQSRFEPEPRSGLLGAHGLITLAAITIGGAFPTHRVLATAVAAGTMTLGATALAWGRKRGRPRPCLVLHEHGMRVSRASGAADTVFYSEVASLFVRSSAIPRSRRRSVSTRGSPRTTAVGS